MLRMRCRTVGRTCWGILKRSTVRHPSRNRTCERNGCVLTTQGRHLQMADRPCQGCPKPNCCNKGITILVARSYEHSSWPYYERSKDRYASSLRASVIRFPRRWPSTVTELFCLQLTVFGWSGGSKDEGVVLTMFDDLWRKRRTHHGY